jgi:hypothetical protein
MLSVAFFIVMLSVIMQSVVMLRVVAPFQRKTEETLKNADGERDRDWEGDKERRKREKKI